MSRTEEALAHIRAELEAIHEKVDRIVQNTERIEDSTQAASHHTVISQPVTPVAHHVTPQAAPTKNYGRALTSAEQAYIDRLYGRSPAAPASSAAKATHRETASELHMSSQQSVSTAMPVTRFFQWIARDWPMKVGGFFVIAAVGWFVTYAALTGLLSETGRIVLGYLFSVGCLAFGASRIRVSRMQGNTFLVISGAVMLITTLGGIYFDVVVPAVGLFVMLLTVGLISLLALHQKSKALTVVTICFGIFIPAFFFSSVSLTVMFSYLFILSVGTLWIVRYTQWRVLTILMVIAIGCYSIGQVMFGPADLVNVPNLTMAVLFIALFYSANVAAMLGTEKPKAMDTITALLLGFLVWMWIAMFSAAELHVWLLVSAALLFAGTSYGIFMMTARALPTLVYGGVSIALLAIATALQFDGPVLVTALAVEAAVGAIVALMVMRDKMSALVGTIVVATYAIPVMMSLHYIPFGARDIDALFAVFMITVTALAIAAVALRVAERTSSIATVIGRLFIYGGGVYAVVLVWLAAHFFISSTDVAVFTALFMYTVTGVLFYVIGSRQQSRQCMTVGSILFAIVIARVLFVEFWEMDMIMRIITSFVLGVLLISTAFLRSSQR